MVSNFEVSLGSQVGGSAVDNFVICPHELVYSVKVVESGGGDGDGDGDGVKVAARRLADVVLDPERPMVTLVCPEDLRVAGTGYKVVNYHVAMSVARTRISHT